MTSLSTSPQVTWKTLHSYHGLNNEELGGATRTTPASSQSEQACQSHDQQQQQQHPHVNVLIPHDSTPQLYDNTNGANSTSVSEREAYANQDHPQIRLGGERDYHHHHQAKVPRLNYHSIPSPLDYRDRGPANTVTSTASQKVIQEVRSATTRGHHEGPAEVVLQTPGSKRPEEPSTVINRPGKRKYNVHQNKPVSSESFRDERSGSRYPDSKDIETVVSSSGATSTVHAQADRPPAEKDTDRLRAEQNTDPSRSGPDIDLSRIDGDTAMDILASAAAAKQVEQQVASHDRSSVIDTLRRRLTAPPHDKHQSHAGEDSAAEIFEEAGSKELIEGKYACDRCKAEFLDNLAYAKHNLQMHKVFTCSQCMHTFTSKPNLERHVRLHTGQTPYQCSKCGQGFSRKDNFTLHQLLHKKPKPFTCTFCGKSYKDRYSLKMHFTQRHNMTLLHTCMQCGEGYADTQLYLQHRRSHPEVDQYECKKCGEHCLNALALMKHKQSHSDVQKKYRCRGCEQEFLDPSNYIKHLEGHRDREDIFDCWVCGKTQQTFDKLVKHEGKHAYHEKMKENEFKECRICFQLFKSRNRLVEHMRSVHNTSPMSMPTEAETASSSSSMRNPETENSEGPLHGGPVPDSHHSSSVASEDKNRAPQEKISRAPQEKISKVTDPPVFDKRAHLPEMEAETMHQPTRVLPVSPPVGCVMDLRLSNPQKVHPLRSPQGQISFPGNFDDRQGDFSRSFRPAHGVYEIEHMEPRVHIKETTSSLQPNDIDETGKPPSVSVSETNSRHQQSYDGSPSNGGVIRSRSLSPVPLRDFHPAEPPTAENIAPRPHPGHRVPPKVAQKTSHRFPALAQQLTSSGSDISMAHHTLGFPGRFPHEQALRPLLRSPHPLPSNLQQLHSIATSHSMAVSHRMAVNQNMVGAQGIAAAFSMATAKNMAAMQGLNSIHGFPPPLPPPPLPQPQHMLNVPILSTSQGVPNIGMRTAVTDVAKSNQLPCGMDAMVIAPPPIQMPNIASSGMRPYHPKKHMQIAASMRTGEEEGRQTDAAPSRKSMQDMKVKVIPYADERGEGTIYQVEAERAEPNRPSVIDDPQKSYEISPETNDIEIAQHHLDQRVPNVTGGSSITDKQLYSEDGALSLVVKRELHLESRDGGSPCVSGPDSVEGDHLECSSERGSQDGTPARETSPVADLPHLSLYTCSTCAEEFTEFEQYEEHCTGLHSRFPCQYCGKTFTQRGNCARHVRFHTGERPYHCQVCYETFARKDDLKYHQTTKHIRVVIFKCQVCQQKFLTKAEMDQHCQEAHHTNNTSVQTVAVVTPESPQ